MRRRCRADSFLLIIISSLLVCVPVSADVYKYVDKHGRVHFTDKPLNSQYKKIVETWKGWVEHKPSYISNQTFVKNMKKFTPTVDIVAVRYNIPNTLLHAIITAESAYNPSAVSRAGAVGLMQLMPATAKRYGVKNRLNPHENIHGGSRYFRDLLKMFDGDLPLALAAYNAGENAVKKYGNKIPPYKETQTYVERVIKYYKKYQKSMS